MHTPPAYVPGSCGHWLGTSFNMKFHVTFPGWPTGIPGTRNRDDLPVVWAQMSPKGSAKAGEVIFIVALPREGQDPIVAIEAMVTSDRQGIMDLRPPTKDEIAALRAQWWTIRDAVVLDTDGAKGEFFSSEEVIACFARAEPVFLSTGLKMRREDPDFNRFLLAGSGAMPNPAPPLPALPSAQPTPSESATATPFQVAMQQAITGAEGSMSQIGNGYAWTVEMVLGHLEATLATQIPGFSLSDYRFDAES